MNYYENLNMDLDKLLKKNYGIEAIQIEKTHFGSGNTYYIKTMTDEFLAKFNNRKEFIAIYEKIEPLLTKENLKQSKIIKTKRSQNSIDNFVLYEYIKGETHQKLTEIKLNNAIIYMKKYHTILKRFPFKQEDLPINTAWDKARLDDFIKTDDSDIRIGLEILTKQRELINVLPKQLIHSDLGPDNFLFIENEVESIIDFTPFYHHEYYALAQFLYWNYLWINPKINKEEIDQYLFIYQNEVTKSQQHLFYLLILQVAIYRIHGIILENSGKSIQKRLIILKQVLNLIKSV